MSADKKTCVVLGAGDFSINEYDKELWQDAFVIVTDSAVKYLEEMNLTADVAIGDWDSLIGDETHRNMDESLVKAFVKEQIEEKHLAKEIVILPVEKDETDSLAAVQYGFDHGFEEFHLYGMLGGERVEHSIANMQVLLHLHRMDYKVYLHTKNQVMTTIENEEITFDEKATGDISLLALDPMVEDVTVEGLMYVASHVNLANDYPLGISNSFVGKKSRIQAGRGALLFVCSKEAMTHFSR